MEWLSYRNEQTNVALRVAQQNEWQRVACPNAKSMYVGVCIASACEFGLTNDGFNVISDATVLDKKKNSILVEVDKTIFIV